MLSAKSQKLAEDNMKVATAIARRIGRSSNLPPSIRLDDLVSFGYLGLVEAAKRFNSKKGVSFGAFAARRVEGAIYDGIRDADPVSRHFRKRAASRGEEPIRFVRLTFLSWKTNGKGNDLYATDEPQLDTAARKESIKEILALVSREHRAAFVDYFFKHRNMRDIGAKLGVSESRISQRLRQAIREVREKLCPKMLRDKSPLGWYNNRRKADA